MPKTKPPSQSAFVSPRVLIGLLLCLGGMTMALFAFRSVSAQSPSQGTPLSGIYRGLSPIVHFDISPPLRDITPIPPGFGGPCQTQNAGDPVVLYDQLADRWLLSQFTSGSAPFYNCVAISQTSNPTGSYYRYAILTGTTGGNFPDYPKYGIWPDAYYISTREFLGGSGGAFQGVGAYALNRAQMIAGNTTPQVISFLMAPSPSYNIGDGILPADPDGTTR